MALNEQARQVKKLAVFCFSEVKDERLHNNRDN